MIILLLLFVIILARHGWRGPCLSYDRFLLLFLSVFGRVLISSFRQVRVSLGPISSEFPLSEACSPPLMFFFYSIQSVSLVCLPFSPVESSFPSTLKKLLDFFSHRCKSYPPPTSPPPDCFFFWVTNFLDPLVTFPFFQSLLSLCLFMLSYLPLISPVRCHKRPTQILFWSFCPSLSSLFTFLATLKITKKPFPWPLCPIQLLLPTTFPTASPLSLYL